MSFNRGIQIDVELSSVFYKQKLAEQFEHYYEAASDGIAAKLAHLIHFMVEKVCSVEECQLACLIHLPGKCQGLIYENKTCFFLHNLPFVLRSKLAKKGPNLSSTIFYRIAAFDAAASATKATEHGRKFCRLRAHGSFVAK